MVFRRAELGFREPQLTLKTAPPILKTAGRFDLMTALKSGKNKVAGDLALKLMLIGLLKR